MFERLKKLKYGVRVLLSRGGGQPETIDLHGRRTVLMHAGDGTPFVYLHSALGESFMWLPFYAAWATPNDEGQIARFGKVVLKDENLSQYCLWYHGLSPAERREWDLALARLQPGDDHRAALEAFRFMGEEMKSADPANKTPVSGRMRELILPGL